MYTFIYWKETGINQSTFFGLIVLTKHMYSTLHDMMFVSCQSWVLLLFHAESGFRGLPDHRNKQISCLKKLNDIPWIVSALF